MSQTLLHVNLSTGLISRNEIPTVWQEQFIGGSGLGVRILWDYLRPDIEPLDEENPLLWITGPLTGSAGPTTGRFTVCGRSPQTGLWGESNIGGFVGPELRFAGYAGVLITGRAPEPVYLWIHNETVEIRQGGHLWGQTDIYETQRVIRDETSESQAKIACIGLAGENGVKFSGIFSDHGRAAARTGLGTLMGSKNLKALAVRGTGKIPLAHAEEYKKLRVEANKDLLQQNMTSVFKATGTSGAAEYFQMLGDMPQKYWTAPSFEGASKISGGEMAESILVGTAACQGCVISCGRVVSIKDGPYATNRKVKGPEYETICAFGSQLLVDDLAQITALGNWCDRLGLDTISAGSVIGLAYLLFERNIITTKDTGGLELVWGDASPCFSLLEQIARREGIGSLMAMGSKAFAAYFGSEELAVQMNGLDLGMHDPRAFSGQALAYATSPRGACHNQSDYFMIEMGGSIEELGLPMTDRFEDGGKAHMVARHQFWRTTTNSLVYCFFAVVPPQTIADLLSNAMGTEWSVDRLLEVGERAWNLKRAYNCRLGLTPKSEKLPKLLLESLPDGGQSGHIPDLPAMLKEYYEACGWNTETGYPLPDKMRSLGLEFALNF
jgi:aldehyde:ferredoxin oxidoreductase